MASQRRRILNVEIFFVERFMLFYMRIVCTEMQVTRITMSMLLLILALTAVDGGFITTRQNFGYVLKQVDKIFLIFAKCEIHILF